MVKEIAFYRKTKEGYTLHVTQLYFLGILFYTKSVLQDDFVVG